jgi:hypothetical protein
MTPAGKQERTLKSDCWRTAVTPAKRTQINPAKGVNDMMHDPFQNTILGSYYGTPTPIGLQYPAALQNQGINPMAQAGGIPQFGQSPYVNPQQVQQLQLASLLAQNPLVASLLSNPLIAASLHAQAVGPYGVPQLGQIGSPFGQTGYPLAPQSWIGQGGFGQVHPFQSQMNPRPFQAQGFSPWGY